MEVRTMDKLNITKTSIIMILFIVLLCSSTYAVEATGSGTKEDPFIVNLSAVATEVTVSYKELPFYFKVTSDMLYEVDCDISNKKVSFIGTSTIQYNADGTTNENGQYIIY